MIRPICRDTVLLSRKAEPAEASDLGVVQDLRDTLLANADRCVGMAANMIGVPKAVIAVLPPGGQIPLIMLNPVITAKQEAYSTEEGCLSLAGSRTIQRYQKITLRFQSTLMKQQVMKFEGYIAQIIQHEVDHLSGFLV